MPPKLTPLSASSKYKTKTKTENFSQFSLQRQTRGEKEKCWKISIFFLLTELSSMAWPESEARLSSHFGTLFFLLLLWCELEFLKFYVDEENGILRMLEFE